jgi:hypothetical protein
MFCRFLILLLAVPALWIISNTTVSFAADIESEDSSLDEVSSVSELSDVKPNDWAFQALRSLVERYGCITGYPNKTYLGTHTLSRYEFAAALNTCADRISELIAVGSNDLVKKEDLTALQKLEQDFVAELRILRGRVDALEAHTATLENQQFSATTKLNAQVITVVSGVLGSKVGSNRNQSETYIGDRGRLNFESSFTGKDLLRVRFEFGTFLDANGKSLIAAATGTNMTRLNFDTDIANILTVPHIRYYFPVNNSVAFVVGPTGIGYTDITDTVTPPTIADDGNGIPSIFGEYSPIFRRGGSGAAVNWNLNKKLMLTLGYLGTTSSVPSQKNGLFNGGYNALAHLAYYFNKKGAVSIAYSRGYQPGNTNNIDVTGSTGTGLAISPFGNTIATSDNIVSAQGYYRFAPHFQMHAWGGYISANAHNSGLSAIPNGTGGTEPLFVRNGDNADAWFGAISMTFPDVGGTGNLPGFLFGIPPHVTNSDVRKDQTTPYHFEAFYRWRLNDNISLTPDFWVIFNPEANSKNDTQYVGVIRTTFDF